MDRGNIILRLSIYHSFILIILNSLKSKSFSRSNVTTNKPISEKTGITANINNSVCNCSRVCFGHTPTSSPIESRTSAIPVSQPSRQPTTYPSPQRIYPSQLPTPNIQQTFRPSAIPSTTISYLPTNIPPNNQVKLMINLSITNVSTSDLFHQINNSSNTIISSMSEVLFLQKNQILIHSIKVRAYTAIVTTNHYTNIIDYIITVNILKKFKTFITNTMQYSVLSGQLQSILRKLSSYTSYDKHKQALRWVVILYTNILPAQYLPPSISSCKQQRKWMKFYASSPYVGWLLTLVLIWMITFVFYFYWKWKLQRQWSSTTESYHHPLDSIDNEWKDSQQPEFKTNLNQRVDMLSLAESPKTDENSGTNQHEHNFNLLQTSAQPMEETNPRANNPNNNSSDSRQKVSKNTALQSQINSNELKRMIKSRYTTSLSLLIIVLDRIIFSIIRLIDWILSPGTYLCSEELLNYNQKERRKHLTYHATAFFDMLYYPLALVIIAGYISSSIFHTSYYTNYY